jgi:hypothetical protein
VTSSAKPHRGSMARAGKATPAAPNPLTKLRRLADPGLLGEFSLCNFLSGAMWLLLPAGSALAFTRGDLTRDVPAPCV